MTSSSIDFIQIDNHRLRTTIDIYFKWKDLNTAIRTLSTRGINFPGEISENIVCYVCDYLLKKDGAGDAKDPKTGKIIEIKGSSSDGPSSFSPSEDFDELVFAKLNKDDDLLFIYHTKMNSLEIGNIMVNQNTTFAQQQKAGRRPRFNIETSIIIPNNIEPSYIFEFRTRTIR